MAECIIARGGGKIEEGSELPPVISGFCSILAEIVDPEGNPIENLSVHCKDGSTWYNYHTNDKGQVLFITNSGSANITAWNFSIQDQYKWLDLNYTVKNVDAPVTTSKKVELALPKLNNTFHYGYTSNIYEDCYSGGYKVRVANTANIFLYGAGGGGGADSGLYNIHSGGGGGGAGNTANNISLTKNHLYSFFIGSGGNHGYGIRTEVAWQFSPAEAGGTSSVLGYTAIGGMGGRTGSSNSAQAYGGAGGTGTYNGGNGGGYTITTQYNTAGSPSENSLFGGGGSGLNASSLNVPGGSPYGGWYIQNRMTNLSKIHGQYGGGGGAGPYDMALGGVYNGGDGGNGGCYFWFD